MCGIIAVITKTSRDIDGDTRKLLSLALPGTEHLKNRGKCGAGIAGSNLVNGSSFKKAEAMDYAEQKVDPDYLPPELVSDRLISIVKGLAFANKPNVVMGQTKYTTGTNTQDMSKETVEANCQPTQLTYKGQYYNGVELTKDVISIHNGDVDPVPLKKVVQEAGVQSPLVATVDSRWLAEAFHFKHRELGDYFEAGKWIMEHTQGSFSFGYCDGEKLVVMKDKWGFRPLCYGTIDNTLVFMSESAFFEEKGIRYQDEINPGEMVVVDKQLNLERRVLVDHPHKAFDPFEIVYLMNNHSRVPTQPNKLVYDIRFEWGWQMAIEQFSEQDIREIQSGSAVIAGAPESGYPYAEGAAARLGSRRVPVLRKPKGANRKFLRGNLERDHWYIPTHAYIENKVVHVFEDSLIRGHSFLEFYKTLIAHGATEVHFHIAWPATIYGCNTGIDRPTHTEQLAYELIRKGILTQGEHKLSYDINMINAEMIHIAREYIQSETDGQIDPRKLFLHYSSPAIVSKLVPGWASSGGLCDYCVSGKWPGGYTREILV